MDEEEVTPTARAPLTRGVALALVAWLLAGVWLATTPMGGAAFLACVCALATLLALALLAPASLWRHGPSAEGFVDGAKAIADRVLLPAMDSLIVGLSTKKGREQREREQQHADDPDAPIPDDRVKSEPIDKAYFARLGLTDEADVARTLLEYKRISFLLCRMRSSDRPRYDQMMAALHAPPPEVDPDTQTE
jgi:hypothetical protein